MNRFDPQIHHRHSIRLQGYDYSQAGAYFVTIATQGRACFFGEVRDGEMQLNAVGKIVQWEWRRLEEKFPPVELGAYVVMPNHFHGIIIIHGAERSPRHATAEPHAKPNPEPNVGATQAGRTGRISGLAIPSNMGTSGTDGSPRHGSTNMPDMEIPAVDGDPDGPGGATRHEQNLPVNGKPSLPDEAIEDMGGSPLHGNDESNVGATQAGQTGGISGGAIQSGMGPSGTGGLPRNGLTDAIDMDFPAGDVESDAAERATRHEQNLPICDNHALPDKAIEDIAGSPLRGPGGPPPQSLGAIIGQWKSRVTKRAWKLPGMHGITIWQRNYYEHIIRDDADLRRIEEYIQNNPLRWAQDQLHPQAPPNQFNQDRTYGN